MTRAPHRPRRGRGGARLAALALAALALAAGCGGGGSEPAAVATPAATAPATAAEATAAATPSAAPSAEATATPSAAATATPEAAATPSPTATPTPTATAAAAPREAPVPQVEVTGLGRWFNSEPFTIADQLAQGRIVLIDFWTYTCINCIRTLPFLQDWHAKYADRGLVILGVHTPEFEFEYDPVNVAEAIERLDVAWPVAQDNEFATWRAFGNRFWPAKYLFGPGGEVIYRHFGEGRYAETERRIRDALTAAGHDVRDIPAGAEEPQRDSAAREQTRELYGGYARNYAQNGLYAAQDEYYGGPDREQFYTDIDTSAVRRVHHQWYLQGLWRNEREAVVHARATGALEDYFAFLFRARSVNVVLNPPRDEPFEVVIEIDGRPLRPGEAGADVVFDADGRSLIRVDEPRHYAIVELPEWGEHDLKLASNSDNFAIFALTFGNYLEGA